MMLILLLLYLQKLFILRQGRWQWSITKRKSKRRHPRHDLTFWRRPVNDPIVLPLDILKPASSPFLKLWCKCSSRWWTLPGFGNAVVFSSIWAFCTITSLCCNWMTRSLSSLLRQEHLGNLHSKKKRLTTNQSSSFVDWWLHDLVLCCHFFYLVNINGFLAGRHMQLDVGLTVRAAKIPTWSIYHPAAQSWPHKLCPPVIITIIDIVNKKHFSTLKAFRTGRTPLDSRCYGTDIPSELF